MAKAVKTDAEVIVDEGDVLELASGMKVTLVPLEGRQFFKMLRILTHGAGGMLLNFKWSGSDSPEEFGAKLLALLAFAIPDAEDEVFDFLLSMLQAVGYHKGRDLTKAQKQENEQLRTQLMLELENPALEDLLTLFGTIVQREAGNLQALGKKAMAMFQLAQKTGQIPVIPQSD